MTNPPQGPLPNGFDFTPTVNWTVYQADLAFHYANCVVLVGES